MTQKQQNRRRFLGAVTGALGLSFWDDRTLDAAVQHVNGNSKPSELKITDMRVATSKARP